MDNIVDIDKHMSIWTVSNNRCLICKHKFVSVQTFDTDTTKLECSKCGGLKTLSILVEIKK